MEPGLQFIFEARVLLDPPLEFGDVARGSRRIVPIIGGDIAGADIKGEVLRGGADWQIVRTDGVAELDARYTLKTDDGALIHVRNLALRRAPPEVMAAAQLGKPHDASLVYCRGATFFEASSPRYAWLTESLVVSTIERGQGQVKVRFYKVT